VANSRSTFCAVWCAASVEDIGLADPQALVQAIAAKDMYDFLGSPEGEIAVGAMRALSRQRTEIERSLHGARRGDARGGGARIVDAAGEHLERADQADEESRLRQGLRIRSRGRGQFFRRELFPDGMARSICTQPKETASSARFKSAWTIGRSCGRRKSEALTGRPWPRAALQPLRSPIQARGLQFPETVGAAPCGMRPRPRRVRPFSRRCGCRAEPGALRFFPQFGASVWQHNCYV